MQQDPAQLWQSALRYLRQHVSEANYQTWLADTEGVRLDGSTLIIGTRSEFVTEWLQQRLRPLMVRTLTDIADRPLEVAFEPLQAPAGRHPAAPAQRCGRACGARLPAPEAAQPLRLRHVHRRTRQPPRLRRRRGRGRLSRHAAQPAVPLRRGRPRQDAPAAGHRAPPRPRRPADHLHLRGAVHERPRDRHPAAYAGGVPRALPLRRCAADRRHPVRRRQGGNAGGAVPHVQQPLRGGASDRDHLGQEPGADPGPRGAPEVALRVGDDRRHPGARPRGRASRSCARRRRSSACASTTTRCT